MGGIRRVGEDRHCRIGQQVGKQAQYPDSLLLSLNIVHAIQGFCVPNI